MIINKINDTIIVKVICGNCIGTAFFVAENLLLTARHNVVLSKTDDEQIYIDLQDKRYEAILIYEDLKQSGDFSILEIKEYNTPSYLSCLCMPLRKGDEYSFMGYPQTILGQVVGSKVGIKIYMDGKKLHITEGFDCTATIIGGFMPSTFTGFSGSPVYNEEEFVIGIITHKLDGCIGFVSFHQIADTFRNQSLILESDYKKYDKSEYSISINQKKVEKAINIAGPRYMRDLHVLTEQFNKCFEYAIKTSYIEKKLTDSKRKLDKIKDFIKKSSLSIFQLDRYDFKNDLISSLDKYDISSDNNDMHHCLDTLNEILDDNRKNKGAKNNNKELFDLINNWDAFYSDYINIRDEIENNYKYFKEPYICIKGMAGSGKTHLLCHIAERYVKMTNVYICFGNQFDGFRDIEEQLQQIFEFSSSNYLQELNNISNENRTVIIIDALNEGVGYHLWESKLSAFRSFIKQFPNICLLISVREPFDKKIFLNNSFNIITHGGYEDKERAKEVYFKHYKINISEIPFETPEFANPLFLKIFSETFSSLNPYQRSKINKLWSLFAAYIRNKELLISHNVDFDPHLYPVRQFIKNVATTSIKAKDDKYILMNISRTDAHTISNRIIPSRTWSKSLLYWVLEEGLFISNIRYDHDSKGIDSIDFAYERMGDIYKVLSFLKLKFNEQKKYLNKIIKKDNPQSYNFLVALSSIIPDYYSSHEEIYDIFPMCFEKNLVVKTAYMDSLIYRNIESISVKKLLKEKIFKFIDDKTFFYSFFNYLEKIANPLNAITLHQILSDLSFTELNQRWTYTINTLYDERRLENFYSIEQIKSIEKLEKEEQYNYLVFLCWLLSSSYPIVRDRVTRIITFFLRINLSFSIQLIEKFQNVKDLYILERLVCSIYGSILLSDDNKYIEEVANSIIKCIFKVPAIPCHIHLRHYARMIVERAYTLQLIEYEVYKLSIPPYYSSNNEDFLIISDENISKLGNSKGTEQMLSSIGVTNSSYDIGSDYYRYTLGGNTRINSVFSKISNKKEQSIKKDEYFTIDELVKIISNEIYLMGWNDEIGKLDNGKYSQGRFENKIERIGKKFQWLGLYSAIAKLTDHNFISDSSFYNPTVIDYMNPDSVGYNDYFDPTLPISKLQPQLSLVFNDINTFECNKEDIGWFSTIEDVVEKNNFVIADSADNKWVRLSGLDVWKCEMEDSKKEIFLRYDCYFIKENKLESFRKWAKNQNFYGRWMPEIGDNIDFKLYEYPWATTYKKLNIEWKQDVENNCPCQVQIPVIQHLQEDISGIEKDDFYNHNTSLPCEDIFISMNLKLSNIRGFIIDDLGSIAAFDSNYVNKSIDGLYIRQDILEKYLKDKKMSLVMTVLGDKEEFLGTRLKNIKYISGYYEYNHNEHFVGSIRMI